MLKLRIALRRAGLREINVGSVEDFQVCALYCTALCYDVLCCTVLCYDELYCTVLHCAMMYCAVLYCAILYCTVLYRRLFVDDRLFLSHIVCHHCLHIIVFLLTLYFFLTIILPPPSSSPYRTFPILSTYFNT